MENAALIAHRFNSTTNRPKPHTQKGPYLVPLLKRLLNKKMKITDAEVRKVFNLKRGNDKATLKKIIMLRYILNAVQGENQAIEGILDRIDGKAVQIIEAPNIPAVQLFVTNIIQKAGINEPDRKAPQGDRES